MASDPPLQAIGAYLLAIAKAHPEDIGDGPCKLQTTNTQALSSLTACLHEAVDTHTQTNEEEYLRNSLLTFYNVANVFAGAISKRPEKRKRLCHQIEEILSAPNSTDMQPAALSKKPDLDQSLPRLTSCNGSPPKKMVEGKLPALLSPLNSKVVGFLSDTPNLDPKPQPDHDHLEEFKLMERWDRLLRPENTGDGQALLSESSWYKFVSMCQCYNDNLDECQKLYEKLLQLPSDVSDPFAKALASWRSATELQMRRDSHPLRPYLYRWQLLRFRSHILEIAGPSQATKKLPRPSTSSPPRSHEIPRFEIIAIIEKMLKTSSSLSQYPLLQKFLLANDGDDMMKEEIINKFDEAEHLRMMTKNFGKGVLALIPPGWQPFPFVWDHAAATVSNHVAVSCPGITQLCSLIEHSCMSTIRSSNRGRIPEQNLPWKNGELQKYRKMVQDYVRTTSYSTNRADLLEQSATAKVQGLGLPQEYQSSVQAALDMQVRLSRAPKDARTDAPFSFVHPAKTVDPSSPQKHLGSKRVSLSCEEVCMAASSKERSIILSPEKKRHVQMNR